MGKYRDDGEEVASLRRENAFLRTILDSVQEAIYAIDAENRIVVHNLASERSDGYGAELIGRKETDMFPEWVQAFTTPVRNSGKPIINKYHVQTQEDRELKIFVDCYPFYYENKLEGIYSFCWDHDTLLQNLTTSQAIYKLLREHVRKQISADDSHQNNTIIGCSQQIQQLKSVIETIADKNSPVMILGETGTGKELFAKAIHYASKNKSDPFLAINCAAIPETLLESILFGTMKGAFTGAADMPGLFEQAEGGTIFLDEINSMPMSMQPKLLRVLQEKTIRRLGGDKEIPVHCRVLSASNEDLPNTKTLRMDLFYRLGVVILRLPPLRERKEDIPLLCLTFIEQYNRNFQVSINDLSPELLKIFEQYDWPGNVRELQNIVECGMNFVGVQDYCLDVTHFPHDTLLKISRDKIKKDYWRPSYSSMTLKEVLRTTEKNRILDALEQNRWNITHAAEELGILRQNLNKKMKEYDIRKPQHT